MDNSMFDMFSKLLGNMNNNNSFNNGASQNNQTNNFNNPSFNYYPQDVFTNSNQNASQNNSNFYNGINNQSNINQNAQAFNFNQENPQNNQQNFANSQNNQNILPMLLSLFGNKNLSSLSEIMDNFNKSTQNDDNKNEPSKENSSPDDEILL